MTSFKISSTYRSTGTSSNFTVSTGATSANGLYSLFEAYIPNTFYNINSTNNQVYFNDGVDRIALLSPGSYQSFPDLITELQLQMNAVSTNTYTVEYQNLTKFLKITGTGNFYFTWKTNTTNSARVILGFSPLDGTASLVQTGDLIANLSIITSFNITVNGVGNIYLGNNTSTTFSIPIDVISGAIVHYKANNNKQLMTFDRIVTSFTVSIRDDNGNILDLKGGELYLILKKE